jgi:capsular polysaccharide transport system permease protein
MPRDGIAGAEDTPINVAHDFSSKLSVRRLRVRERLPNVRWLFLLTVVVPTALAMLYFGFLASDVYVSESQFVVRSPDKPATTGLGALLKSTGFSNAGEEVYAAQDYILSRDALGALNKNGAVAHAYHNGNVSIIDRFNPVGMHGSMEDLYRYYRGKVGVDYDSTSSVSTLVVRAYSPEDAYRFNRELLELAEGVVNKLNVRGRSDLIGYASREVRESQVAARSAALALASFRNAHGVVDPEEQAKAQLELVSKLQDELIGARVQLQQLESMAPENPQVPLLHTRVSGLQRQIDEQMGQVAGNRRSLSASAVQYERLELERQFADRRLAAALSSLQDAENEARRKQAYVERLVPPNLPDSPTEPRRFRGILATLILGLVAWGVLSMLLAGLREHQG